MVASRKNIFLIGRRLGDENQLTEMLAFLWQERPELVGGWLDRLGIADGEVGWEVETQFVLPSGKRPDMVLTAGDAVILVESKLESAFGGLQLFDYLDYLEHVPGRRSLVVLTKYIEQPVEAQARAKASGVELVATRWQDMTDFVAEPGEDSLAGDFVQLLIREGLVKPDAFRAEDWRTWNAGYQVVLRLTALLDEAGPLVQELFPSLTSTSPGLTKRWIYRLWKSESLQVGIGFGAAEQDQTPHTEPIIFAMVYSPSATKEAARDAVGGRGWKQLEEPPGAFGLLWSEWPTRVCTAAEVLTETDFTAQTRQAVGFLQESAMHFSASGYALPEVRVPASAETGP